MKTTERFEKAVKALYTAFHEETLNYCNCSACAVGNILGHGMWYGGTPGFYITGCDPVRKIVLPGFNDSGYSAEELAKVEYLFIMAHEDYYHSGNNLKENQFNGLCAVVEYLSGLDGIPNPMDYTKFFEYSEEGAVHELIEL